MTLRLGWIAGSANDWIYADATAEIMFDAVRERVVKMDVRTEVRAALFVTFEDGEPHFLCWVDGLESIEFNTSSAFTLYGDQPIYVRTADSTIVGQPNTDAEIFTKMHDRRPIAPEILEMQKVMHKNMERLKAAVQRDLDGMRRSTERDLEKRRKALAEAEAAAAAAGAKPDDDGKSSSETGGSGAKAEKPAEKDPGKK